VGVCVGVCVTVCFRNFCPVDRVVSLVPNPVLSSLDGMPVVLNVGILVGTSVPIFVLKPVGNRVPRLVTRGRCVPLKVGVCVPVPVPVGFRVEVPAPVPVNIADPIEVGLKVWMLVGMCVPVLVPVPVPV